MDFLISKFSVNWKGCWKTPTFLPGYGGVSVAVAAAAGDNAEFTLLNTALAATGLDAALNEEGDFTLFAPTDAAFLAQYHSTLLI